MAPSTADVEQKDCQGRIRIDELCNKKKARKYKDSQNHDQTTQKDLRNDLPLQSKAPFDRSHPKQSNLIPPHIIVSQSLSIIIDSTLYMKRAPKKAAAAPTTMPGLAMDAAPVKRAIVEEAVPEADEAVLVELWQTPLLQETAT
jgi:hypothetical protein